MMVLRQVIFDTVSMVLLYNSILILIKFDFINSVLFFVIEHKEKEEKRIHIQEKEEKRIHIQEKEIQENTRTHKKRKRKECNDLD